MLILDDDEDSVEMYACGLLLMGFTPATAKTADEAFARACQLKPQVIVADITLPGASGLELTRRLRQDDRTKETGIIVLTGHASTSLEREAYAAGCDRFVLKPCLPDTFAVEIRDVLSGNAKRQRVSPVNNCGEQ